MRTSSPSPKQIRFLRLALLLCILAGANHQAHAQLPPGATEDREEKYEREAIGVDRVAFALVNQYGSAVGGGIRYVFYKGKYRESLDGKAFYQTIGRTDLEDQYRSRRKRRFALIGTGATFMTIGLVGGLAIPFSDPGFSTNPNPTLATAGGVVGGAFGVAGAAILLAGRFLSVDPVSHSEKLRLVDEYNQALRRSLGLAAAKAVSQTLQIRPSLSGREVGLVASGAF